MKLTWQQHGEVWRLVDLKREITYGLLWKDGDSLTAVYFDRNYRSGNWREALGDSKRRLMFEVKRRVMEAMK